MSKIRVHLPSATFLLMAAHVLEHVLGEAKRREAAVAALGQVASLPVKHRAQIDRLDIEIQLERLRSK